MQAMAPARDPALRVPFAALLGEPLFWAAAAAFVGAALGLMGWPAALAGIAAGLLRPPLGSGLAEATQHLGVGLAALSLLGVPSLLRGGSRTAGWRAAHAAGVLLLVLLVVASVTSAFYSLNFYTGEGLATLSFWALRALAPAVVLLFSAAAFARRKARLGALLAGLFALNLPLQLATRLISSDAYTSDPTYLVVLQDVLVWGVLGWALWALVGMVSLRAARERVYGKAERLQAEVNLKRARRLYEEGLDRGDLSLVDELVSEDFLDLRHGGRGKPGMRRLLRSLRESFPDLTVEVAGQEAEGDLVRTRLILSGTDRGSGVLFHPPSGRRASFSAEFMDRFSRGELVEHGGSTDTEGLLRQLGHIEGGRSASEPNF